MISLSSCLSLELRRSYILASFPGCFLLVSITEGFVLHRNGGQAHEGGRRI